MKRIMILPVTALFLTSISKVLTAQPPTGTNQTLDTKQQSIVAISAFTAKGDLSLLRQSLQDGLNAGLTISEVKEILVQLYAYTGFPRSLNALQTLMTVLNERKQQGVIDEPGKDPNPLPVKKTKLQLGAELQTKLVGRPVEGAVYDFAPIIDQFLKEHLFGDIFGRDNLDFKTREIATIAALAALGRAENQLRSHFNVGMYNGLTPAQLGELVAIIHSKLGRKEGTAALKVLQEVLGQQSIAAPTGSYGNTDIIFPKGEKITNNNFTGTAWLHQMVMSDSSNQTQVGNVTFEPGARTNWHLHPGGQILLVTSGTGYYQEKDQPKRILRKGDVVKCPPNIPHWHGASHDSEFIQVALTATQKGPTVWLQPVTDEEYNKRF